MLNVVMPGAAPDASLLYKMFAARKSVFVDLLGWDVPVSEGKYEVDQFDTEHARYLIVSEDDSHVASARLLPTIRGGILSNLFPVLCTGPCPSGDTIFEITRFCLDRRLRAHQRRAARDTLVTGLVTHALDAGITAYCAVAETSWYGQIANFGWQCRPLGPAVRIAGEDLIGLQIEITAETPRRLAQAGLIGTNAATGSCRIAA